MTKNKNLYHLVLTAILSALIVVMTVVPYTGYIPYGVVTEITTLHIVTIVGAVFLGWILLCGSYGPGYDAAQFIYFQF